MINAVKFITLSFRFFYLEIVKDRTQYAVVAQSVEHFLGKEEVRQFKSAQQLQRKRKRTWGRLVRASKVTLFL